MEENCKTITYDFEKQNPISDRSLFIECSENLYEDRITTWYEYIPSSYTASKAIPLVMQMHGGGGSGLKDAQETSWQIMAQRYGFIVVYPNANIPGKWLCDEADVETIRLLIEHLCKKYHIDRSRIYMQGMSNGEMITTAFVLTHPEYLAAAGFICGPLPPDMIPHMPKGSLPVIQIRGEKDVFFPHKTYERKDVYEPKSRMNDFNRLMWIEANHTSNVPDISFYGKGNFFLYRGTPCDVIYWEVKDMGHRYPINVPELFWNLCYSRYRRKRSGQIEKLSEDVFFPSFNFTFACAAGSGQIITNQGFHLLSAPILKVLPARQIEDSYYDVGEMMLTPGLYAPVEMIPLVLNAEAEKTSGGYRFTSSSGETVELYENTCAARRIGYLHSLKKPCLDYDGTFYFPLVEVFSELFNLHVSVQDDVIAASPRSLELSRGSSRILASLLGAPCRYSQPDVLSYFKERF